MGFSSGPQRAPAAAQKKREVENLALRQYDCVRAHNVSVYAVLLKDKIVVCDVFSRN